MLTHRPGTERESRCVRVQALRGLGLAVVFLLVGACTSSSGEESAALATPANPTVTAADEAEADTPTPSRIPEPSPTSVPTATPEPSPTPTPDPLVAEAEAVAVAYFLAIHRIADDVRVADASEAIQLEATGGPLENYALRLINDTLKEGDYLEFDDLRWEVIGSEVVNPSVGAVDVSLCVQTSGEWRDFETDEVTLRSATSEPFVSRYEIRRDGEGSGLKVWTFVDTDEDDEIATCEFNEGEP